MTYPLELSKSIIQNEEKKEEKCIHTTTTTTTTTTLACGKQKYTNKQQ